MRSVQKAGRWIERVETAACWDKATALRKACHSERSDEGAKPKNLRIFDTATQFFGAKILRLAMLAQDDKLD